MRHALTIAAAASLARAETTKELYEREGFFILPSLLSPSATATVNERVNDHIREKGHMYRNVMNGNNSGGWYIANFPSVPSLHSILDQILAEPRLTSMLDDLLGAGQHRLLSRSEIYSDRTNWWHSESVAHGTFE